MPYFILYIVALSILIIILATINSKKQMVTEGFEASYRPIHLQPYADKYYTRQNVNPIEMLPVDYQEIEYRNSSSDRHYAIDNNNQSGYCKEHPNCYPCPGWKLSLGNPMCT